MAPPSSTSIYEIPGKFCRQGDLHPFYSSSQRQAAIEFAGKFWWFFVYSDGKLWWTSSATPDVAGSFGAWNSEPNVLGGPGLALDGESPEKLRVYYRKTGASDQVWWFSIDSSGAKLGPAQLLPRDKWRDIVTDRAVAAVKFGGVTQIAVKVAGTSSIGYMTYTPGAQGFSRLVHQDAWGFSAHEGTLADFNTRLYHVVHGGDNAYWVKSRFGN